MVDGDLIRRWIPRLVAPIAFFAAATVLVLLIQGALDGASDASPTGATVQTQPPTGTGTGSAGNGATTKTPTGTTKKKKKRFYRVKSGDTLDVIAAKFNTTTIDLLDLNPDIDPLSLTVGQRLRVR